MRLLLVWGVLGRLESRQRGGQGGLLLRGQAGELQAALVESPSVAVDGLLCRAKAGPRDPPQEPDPSEGRGQVHVADPSDVERFPVRDPRPQGAKVEHLHELKFQFTPAEASRDRESADASSVWSSSHMVSPLPSLMVAATIVTTVVRNATAADASPTTVLHLARHAGVGECRHDAFLGSTQVQAGPPRTSALLDIAVHGTREPSRFRWEALDDATARRAG